MPRKKTNSGKKHKGFYIYSRDLLSSQRYRRCSWATKGVYLDLLNVLAVQDHPGALCLRDFDLKPRGERSLTQRCLACQRKAKNGEYQSIKYFAEAIAISASGPRPGLIHGLQELYLRGIICIVGDTLIQPRMYRDSGIEVIDADGQPIDVGEGEYMTVVGSPDDGEADPDAEKIRLAGMAESSANNGVQNGVQKSTENSRPRVGAGDAPAQSKRVGVRVNNKNSIGSSKGGAGETTHEGEKSDDVKTDATPSVKSDTTQGKPAQIPVADCPPTLEQIQAYIQEQGELGRIFRYITAEEYYDEGCKSGWMQRGGRPLYDWKAQLRSFEAYRRNHGDTPVAARGQQPTAPKQGDPVQATPPKDGKYRKW